MRDLLLDLDKEKLQLKKFYISLALMATLGGFLYGYDQSDIGSALIFIPYYQHASVFVVGYIASGALLGAAIGAATAALLTDKYGRKFFLIADIGVYAVGIILSITTINVFMLMLARTVVGFAIGADSAVATAYISEFTPKTRRGRSGAMQQYMIILGIFLSYLVAMATFMAIPSLAYSIDWRIILGLAIIPAIIALVIRVKMPESPRWLILNRKFDVATKTLKKFEVESNASDLDYTYKLLETEQKNAQKLDAGTKRALLISGLFMVFYIANGVNIPLIYGPYIISSLSIFPSSTSKVLTNAYSIGATAILVAVMLVATYYGMSKIDKLGRRKLALIGFIGMAASDFVGGILYLLHFDIGLLFGLAGYLIFFGIGGGVVAWLIQGEYFPTTSRGFFAAIVALIDWVTSFVVDEIFPYMDSVLHLGYSVIAFAIVSVIAVITLYYIMPETKNLSVEEISDMFRDTDLGKLRKYNIVEVKETDDNIPAGDK
jgi:SP family arabinose:H+ symporter-like MFS transporter